MNLRASQRALWAIALMLGVGLSANAWAGTINIGTGAGNTPNPTGLAGAGDPNLIGSGGTISIYLQGSASATSTILLVLAEPGGAGSPAGPTSITLYSSYPGGSTATLGIPAFTNVLGTVDAGTNALISDGFNNSNNFANFSAFDASLGLTTTSFDVYAWTITTGALDGHDNPLINIVFSSGQPTGSVFAALTDNGNSTVWTNAGGVTSVPEPATWLLLLTGLGVLGLALRTRSLHAV